MNQPTITLGTPYKEDMSIKAAQAVLQAVRERFPEWADQCEPYVNVLTLRGIAWASHPASPARAGWRVGLRPKPTRPGLRLRPGNARVGWRLDDAEGGERPAANDRAPEHGRHRDRAERSRVG